MQKERCCGALGENTGRNHEKNMERVAQLELQRQTLDNSGTAWKQVQTFRQGH